MKIMLKFLFTVFVFTPCLLNGQINYKYLQNQTFTVDESTAAYQLLEKNYPGNCKLQEIGLSDIGRPIHLFVITSDGDFDADSNRKKGKICLFINNAIHAGEPPGVDASVKFAEAILKDRNLTKLLEDITVCIIPFYNVDGGLNRNCCSRANQNGPLEYGFRGNAQNRDLNRDFIKCDTRNTAAFTKAFQLWKPEIFIDTHDTNGSDFQYVMTLITSQLDKQEKIMATYQREKFLPKLYEEMKNKNFEMVPYVNFKGATPESGLVDFLETPRYSTGYSTLFASMGFVTETLKYKSFPERVEATYAFLVSIYNLMKTEKKEMLRQRALTIENIKNKTEFELVWQLDTNAIDSILFKGYETRYDSSSFGQNAQVLTYDHSKPYSKKIPYYQHYNSSVKVRKPEAYVIPQAYHQVIERLLMNKVEMSRIERDTTMSVEMYFIENYETVKFPYEGHYLHYNTTVRKEFMPVKFHKGDYVAFTNQEANRYLVETLEPEGGDSFFAWNFFDGILQQKEWFSSFSFEPTAKKLLEENSWLRESFEKKKKEDAAFAKDHFAQLYFIYKNSPHYEKTHNRYPVGRIP
jgi:hypothetical protein